MLKRLFAPLISLRPLISTPVASILHQLFWRVFLKSQSMPTAESDWIWLCEFEVIVSSTSLRPLFRRPFLREFDLVTVLHPCSLLGSHFSANTVRRQVRRLFFFVHAFVFCRWGSGHSNPTLLSKLFNPSRFGFRGPYIAFIVIPMSQLLGTQPHRIVSFWDSSVQCPICNFAWLIYLSHLFLNFSTAGWLNITLEPGCSITK